MATFISPQAAVDPRAEIGDDVFIGPFCSVGSECRIGDGSRLENGVTLLGRVTLGQGNQLYPGVVIGGAPQDLSYRGSSTQVTIGDGNTIREGVTINRASEKEDGVTALGSNNYLMACCHVAHDCQLGNHIVMANGTLLGGHVHVHDHASISGGVGIHHFTTIGSYSFVAGLARVLHDVPPYMLVEGHPARPRCINVVALKRHHFSSDEIDALAEAHRLLYRTKAGLSQARQALCDGQRALPAVRELLAFVERQQTGRHGRAREITRRAA